MNKAEADTIFSACLTAVCPEAFEVSISSTISALGNYHAAASLRVCFRGMLISGVNERYIQEPEMLKAWIVSCIFAQTGYVPPVRITRKGNEGSVLP